MSSQKEKKTTLERQKEFLIAYAKKGTINGACNESDIHRNTVRHWKWQKTKITKLTLPCF